MNIRRTSFQRDRQQRTQGSEQRTKGSEQDTHCDNQQQVTTLPQHQQAVTQCKDADFTQSNFICESHILSVLAVSMCGVCHALSLIELISTIFFFKDLDRLVTSTRFISVRYRTVCNCLPNLTPRKHKGFDFVSRPGELNIHSLWWSPFTVSERTHTTLLKKIVSICSKKKSRRHNLKGLNLQICVSWIQSLS